MFSGAFWINKPKELTSSDVVVRLKIALTKGGYCERGFKIGHGGTLDPFATGALVILVGEATKLADCYLHSIKSYGGLIQLGTRTDSADLTGEVVESSPIPALNSVEWQKFADTFVGEEYWQTPPMHSAKKHQGKNLYELARQGIEVERKAILKKIDAFAVKPLRAREVQAEPDLLEFSVTCESGTYVRVIAEDLAKKAGTVAHLKTLIRTRSSDVTLEKCSSLEEVQAQLAEQKPISEISSFHPLKEVATHLPSVTVTETEAKELLQGYKRMVELIVSRFTSGAQSKNDANLTFPGKWNSKIQKYFIARIPNGAPVALFERTETGYRLQRVILWQP